MPLPVSSYLVAMLLSGPTSPALPPEPCAAPAPIGLAEVALLELLGEDDIFVRRFKVPDSQAVSEQPEVTRARGYRTRAWAMVVVYLKNSGTQPAWAVGAIHLKVQKGGSVKILSARMSTPRLAPGEEGLLVLVTEAPHWEDGAHILLEVHGADGRPGLPLLSGEF